MDRIIVTGGAGFIGTHLVKRLISNGYKVTILDNMSTALETNINRDADMIYGDVSNEKDLKRLPLENVCAVCHLAAQSSGEASFENPYLDFRTNVSGTFHMLEWCRAHNIDRFIFTSSMGVYGKNCDIALDENTPCSPCSNYGVSKLAAENYINYYSSFGMKNTVLRLFNVYGSKQNIGNKKQGMASIYLSFLLKNEPILVKGSMERFRDQTHVSDVVNAISLCINHQVSYGKTYNIATGEKTTVKTLVGSLINVFGESVRYPVKKLEGTPGDIFGCYADVSRIRRELNWQCRHNLESGLKEMIEYFKGTKSDAH